MNCRQAKLSIALRVGEDLTDADRREKLRHHLTGCPECRAHFKRLKGMFHVLEQSEGQQTYDSVGSLWPGLVGRLGQPRPRMSGPRFNGWVPFSVMAAACVLLMIVMEMQPNGNTPVTSSLFGRGVWGAAIGLGQPAERDSPDVENPDRTVDPEESAWPGPSPEFAPSTEGRPASTSSF